MKNILILALSLSFGIGPYAFPEFVAHIPDFGIKLKLLLTTGLIPAGLMAFTDAELSIGANIVLDSLNYDEHLRDVDLVIVGEGSTDKSTQFNKSPVAVAMRAKKLGIPVICLSGSVGQGYSESRDLGISSFFSIVSGPIELKYAIENAHELIVKSTEEIIRSLIL